MNGGSDQFGANLGYPYSQKILPIQRGTVWSYLEFPSHLIAEPCFSCDLIVCLSDLRGSHDDFFLDWKKDIMANHGGFTLRLFNIDMV